MYCPLQAFSSGATRRFPITLPRSFPTFKEYGKAHPDGTGLTFYGLQSDRLQEFGTQLATITSFSQSASE